MKYFALAMSVVYLVVGCLFLFTPFLSLQVTQFRTPLGLVLVAYGIIRGILWQRKYTQSRQQGE
jgi:uncharacterized membrane protein HdeD (DUF308 family)